MRYVVVFSLGTGRSAVHDPSCRNAARKPGYAKSPEIEAESGEEAASIFAEQEELASRGWSHPRVCKCAKRRES